MLANALSPASRTVELIAIGGSAGSIETLARLLDGLPAAYAAPLAVVVHLPRRRPSALAAALQPISPLPIVEAQDKEPLRPGRVHLAPPDYHMLVDEGATLALSVEEPVNFSVPAIDVLFESAAAVFGPRLAAVVLSGANRDGAQGLAAVARAGGLALVQDPRECSSPEMPAAALASTPDAISVSLADLRRVLARLGTSAIPQVDEAPE
jgi:two-component system chemotaxis response regulator CheB